MMVNRFRRIRVAHLLATVVFVSCAIATEGAARDGYGHRYAEHRRAESVQ